jgi:CubicO group peptidase (beta-lactamase class C family)
MEGRLIRILASLWLATLVPTAAAGDAFTREADRMLSAIDASGPGAVVVVSRHGVTVYRASRGMGSVELQVPLSAESAFRVGSVTKSMTAAAILALHDRGKLDLDAPLATWLPAFPQAEVITLRQLLSHTAGVSDAWDAPLTEALDTPRRLALVSGQPLDFAPGTDWRYSNSGYMLLGVVLEKVTGKTWDHAIAELVTAPLGMKDTAFHTDTDIVPALVQGYSKNEEGAITRPVLYSIAGPGAAGGLTSTGDDVVRFIRGVARGDLLRKATVATMFTSVRVGETSVPNGLGVIPGKLRGEDSVEHSGTIDGFSAHYVYLPARDIAVVVLENEDSPKLLARSLARRMAALAMEKPYANMIDESWPETRVASVVGSYVIGTTSRHVVTADRGSLFVARDGGPKRPLVTARGDTLYYAGDGIDYFHVLRDSKGGVTALEFHADGDRAARKEERIIGR